MIFFKKSLTNKSFDFSTYFIYMSIFHDFFSHYHNALLYFFFGEQKKIFPIYNCTGFFTFVLAISEFILRKIFYGEINNLADSLKTFKLKGKIL